MNSSFDLQSYFSKNNRSETNYNSESIMQIDVIYPSNENFIRSGFSIKGNKIILTTESMRRTLYMEESILYYLVEKEDSIIISLSFSEKFFILKFEEKDEFDKLFPKIYHLVRKRNFNNYFEIKNKLGEGSYAKVFSCTRLTDGKEFAAKIIKKSIFISKPHHKEAINKELKILKELDHPNIVGIIEIYEGQSHIYTILELLEGGDLHSRKKTISKLGHEIIVYIITQLLEGLDYIHSQGYMHRDMKPSNVAFKNKNGFLVKIIDFGFVEYLDCMHFTIKKCGTPGYLAPEIFSNDLYDEKIDVFSLGVILISLLSTMIVNKLAPIPLKVKITKKPSRRTKKQILNS